MPRKSNSSQPSRPSSARVARTRARSRSGEAASVVSSDSGGAPAAGGIPRAAAAFVDHRPLEPGQHPEQLAERGAVERAGGAVRPGPGSRAAWRSPPSRRCSPTASSSPSTRCAARAAAPAPMRPPQPARHQPRPGTGQHRARSARRSEPHAAPRRRRPAGRRAAGRPAGRPRPPRPPRPVRPRRT